jgi:glutathione S-transferase
MHHFKVISNLHFRILIKEFEISGIKMEDKLILGYWGFQGRAQVPRYILEYLGVPYEEKRYKDREEWAAAKQNLGMPFPNLPYIIHGNTKVSESTSLIMYICLKFKPELLGSTLEEEVAIQTLCGICYDLGGPLVELMLAREDFEKKKEHYFKETFPQKINLLEKNMGTGDFLNGKNLCHVDSVMSLAEFFAESGFAEFSAESADSFSTFINFETQNPLHIITL